MILMTQMNADGLLSEITEQVIGCAFDVHNTLGAGFLEGVYRNALVIALQERGLACEREFAFAVKLRGTVVGEFRADIVVERSVLVETKACDAIHPAHEAQLLNYLTATGIRVGLLINFGAKVQVKRRIQSHPRPSAESVQSATKTNTHV